MSKRKLAPLALALAATPLLAPAGANAALGGALTINSTLKPDLVSATVVSSSASNGTVVRYCFTKMLGTTPVSNYFFINTYRNSETQASSAIVAPAGGGMCADATFSAIPDPTPFTTATVSNNATNTAAATTGAVVNSANGQINNPDSTALIGSSTNNGTRARTTAPDIATATANANANQVTFTFDEPLAGNLSYAATSPVPHDFFLQNADGTTAATGTTATVAADRKSITVTFVSNGVGTAATAIAGAVRATYNPTALANPQPGTPNADTGTSPPNDLTGQASGDSVLAQSVVISGSGNTVYVDPQSAVIGNGASGTDGSGNQILVTFDQDTGIAAGTALTAAQLANFAAVTSDGRLIQATAGTFNTTNSALLTVPIASVAEYVVAIRIRPGAVNATNTIATLPLGGNAGAFATGFSTGPEALLTTFNANNTATITLDQRATFLGGGGGANTGVFRVDNTGQVVTSDPATISFSGPQVPGQTILLLAFNSLTGTRGLALSPGAFTTSLALAGDPAQPANPPLGQINRQTNLPQILAPGTNNAG